MISSCSARPQLLSLWAVSTALKRCRGVSVAPMTLPMRSWSTACAIVASSRTLRNGSPEALGMKTEL
eukprot:11195522-Lingulodinium_polyedra.AAC.1